MTEPKPDYPYVEFKMIKTIRTHSNPNGVDTPESWYLRVAGVHNNPTKITNYLKTKKHKLIGYGNLEGQKYNDLRNFIDSSLGIGIDSRLFGDEPVKPLDKKVENAKQTRTVGA